MDEYRKWHPEEGENRFAYELPDQLLEVYHRLLDKKFSSGLTPEEEIELAQLNRQLDDAEAAQPLIQSIQQNFVDLADRMLKRNGTMAFVLPVTAITGSSWLKVRKMWAEEYHNVLVITIAHEDIEECAFSADTGMAKCLVIPTKGKRKKTGTGTFVCLTRCPHGELEALERAKSSHF